MKNKHKADIWIPTVSSIIVNYIVFSILITRYLNNELTWFHLLWQIPILFTFARLLWLWSEKISFKEKNQNRYLQLFAKTASFVTLGILCIYVFVFGVVWFIG